MIEKPPWEIVKVPDSWSRPRRTQDVPGMDLRGREPLQPEESDLLLWSNPELIGLTRPRVSRRFWHGIALAVPLALAIWGLLMLGVTVIGAALGLWSHPGEWFQ